MTDKQSLLTHDIYNGIMENIPKYLYNDFKNTLDKVIELEKINKIDVDNLSKLREAVRKELGCEADPTQETIIKAIKELKIAMIKNTQQNYAEWKKEIESDAMKLIRLDLQRAEEENKKLQAIFQISVAKRNSRIFGKEEFLSFFSVSRLEKRHHLIGLFDQRSQLLKCCNTYSLY